MVSINFNRLNIFENKHKPPSRPSSSWINMFFLLARFMVIKDYKIIKANPVPPEMYLFENKSLTQALITDESLIDSPSSNAHKIRHYYRISPIDIEVNINKLPLKELDSIFLGSEKNAGLLNKDGALVMDKDGYIIAQETLYKCPFTVEGIFKKSMDELFEMYHHRSLERGSTRTATALACALIVNKPSICMNQTPYMPEISKRYVGTGRILLYNGTGGLYASFYLEKDPNTRFEPEKYIDVENKIYGVMQLYKFSPEAKRIVKDKRIVGSVESIKKEYYKLGEDQVKQKTELKLTSRLLKIILPVYPYSE